MSQETDIKVKVVKRLDLAEPPKYKVIYINDDVTSFEFVIHSLVTTFEYNEDNAKEKAHEVNDKGSGTVAVLPFEMAEQKGVEVLVGARNAGFPLEVRLEPEG